MDRNYALSFPLANDFNAYVNAALANGEITKDEWYALNNTYFTKLYLSQDNPRGQSGHGGGAQHYAYAHLPIVDAIYKDGTFLDVGCANGHLMEMVHQWAAAVGFDVQVYGIDISEGLVALAKTRLPHWSDHLFLGNSFLWRPEQKFGYVHIGGLGQVPEDDELALFDHLMEHYVADGGRLILGPVWLDFSLDSRYLSMERLLASGVTPTGYVEKTHYSRPNMIRKAIWFDKGTR